MTDREAMRQALDALESGLAFHTNSAVLQNLRTALEQPEQQPVAHCKLIKTNGIFSKAEVTWIGDKLPVEGPLYTTPPAAQRKPLTGEQIEFAWMKAMQSTPGTTLPIHEFARALEAAHGIGEEP